MGEVAKTKRPLPVSSVTAAARLAEDGVARNVATPVPRPETPVETGRPAQFVSVPEAGVPRTGLAPKDVREEAVTPDARVVPVNVPAAAVTVMSPDPLNPVPLILREVCKIVAVAAFPVQEPELPDTLDWSPVLVPERLVPATLPVQATDEGVIAPRVSVIAGLVDGLAIEPESPFAVTKDMD